MTLFYLGDHVSQYDASWYTRVYGCTWTGVANGIRATTGGVREPSPDYIHSLLQRSEETDPNSPGWSIPDACRAAGRYGMTLVNYSGRGWEELRAALDTGHYVILQGDSDQFGSSTCSGAFDGNHLIGINPTTKVEDGSRWHWIDDGICPTGRWERDSTIARYGAKLDPSFRFGVFMGRVPQVDGDSTKGDDMARAIRTEGRRLASSHVVRVRAGAKLYRSAESGGSGIVRRLDESTLLDDFGVPTGTSGFRAVRLLSGQFDGDEDREGGIALVRAEDVTGGPREKTPEELAATRDAFR